MLFEDIVFGPIYSRRLNQSLGINLLPSKKKFCNFNCLYCECGWNEDTSKVIDRVHKKEDVFEALNNKLIEINRNNIPVDSITFSGNGEPTLHPNFAEIIDFVIEKRNKYIPNAKISVLTNATTLSDKDVFSALKKVDNPILKLDSAIEKTFYLISNAKKEVVDMDELIENLISFGSYGIIQTILLRGEHNGIVFDNTTDEEFNAYIDVIKKINPRFVMLYPLDRIPPEKNLVKLSQEEIEIFAQKMRLLSIDVKTY
ncbi:MAG: radical SAM protein [Bacteroidales bacterium]|jgi:wyosine [tRNA(Phe)-imidazoG37] synthetase (radical SAM superfamily)|nr:radical SAM protein [Bacteroidales bacterium]